MNQAGQVREKTIIAIIVIVLGILLYMIISPIFASDTHKDIRVTKVNEKLTAINILPKSYADIEPDEEVKKKGQAPVLSKKPDKTKVSKGKIPKQTIVYKEVIVNPVKKEPTEFEKAVINARVAPIGFTSFKPIKPKPLKNSGHFIDSALEKPVTKYLIQAGTPISAVTVTGENSDLPGNIIAKVDRNVYDSITGQHLLIPQASTLVGSYSSKLKLNQKRIQVTWKEIKFPNGDSISLGKGMPGVGNQGMAGISGDVDNHVFSNAISILGIALLNSSAKQIGNASDGSLKDDTSADVAGDVADAGSDIFKEQMRFGPTIIVGIGSPVRVLLNQDLIFKEPYNDKKN